MPSCQKSKNPAGVEILFEESTHRYTSNIDNKTIEYVSGTTFLSRFFPKFDPTGAITERCAKKEGLTVQQIKAKWEAKGKESCRLGTRCHETIEDILLGRTLRNKAENIIEQKRFQNAINIAKKIKDRLDIVGVEKIVFDHKLKIAGTIDLLAKNKSKNIFYIIDHKTNEKIETENTYNKFCLNPISHIPDNSFYHYALQLNLYAFLLKFGSYVPKNTEFKLFLNHVTPNTVKLLELPNLQNEIKDLIIEFLLFKNQF